MACLITSHSWNNWVVWTLYSTSILSLLYPSQLQLVILFDSVNCKINYVLTNLIYYTQETEYCPSILPKWISYWIGFIAIHLHKLLCSCQILCRCRCWYRNRVLQDNTWVNSFWNCANFSSICESGVISEFSKIQRKQSFEASWYIAVCVSVEFVALQIMFTKQAALFVGFSI